MNEDQIQAVLEQLVITVSFLCEETASLVEERAYRTPLEGQAGVRGKAEQIRQGANSLLAMLDTSH
jgi:hypothetical protein